MCRIPENNLLHFLFLFCSRLHSLPRPDAVQLILHVPVVSDCCGELLCGKSTELI